MLRGGDLNTVDLIDCQYWEEKWSGKQVKWIASDLIDYQLCDANCSGELILSITNIEKLKSKGNQNPICYYRSKWYLIILWNLHPLKFG